jgi:hypothetical protein
VVALGGSAGVHGANARTLPNLGGVAMVALSCSVKRTGGGS